jgi:hypothetical protein
LNQGQPIQSNLNQSQLNPTQGQLSQLPQAVQQPQVQQLPQGSLGQGLQQQQQLLHPQPQKQQQPHQINMLGSMPQNLNSASNINAFNLQNASQEGASVFDYMINQGVQSSLLTNSGNDYNQRKNYSANQHQHNHPNQ